MTRVKLAIEKMTCGHCLGRVKQALSTLDGVRVEDARIGEATVSFDPAVVSEADLSSAIEKEGYSVAAIVRAA
jgi:copper chaperone